ncbi:hypothetical protein HID58_042684, partial [Brassica napus]
SAQKGTDVPSYYPSPYVEKEITIEDFLELEEFLELDDGEQLGDLDSKAAGFHKRVKRIHDHVKIMVPCDVFEAESPIPPD